MKLKATISIWVEVEPAGDVGAATRAASDMLHEEFEALVKDYDTDPRIVAYQLEGIVEAH